MKFGVFVRNMGTESTREILSACVTAAEEAGFDSVMVVDHLALPPDQTEGSGGRYLDPLVTLGLLAGITKRIRLGVGVLVLPYRPAVVTAKQVATLQELSGGRIILGAGVGWLREEFEALGVDPRLRGALADEYLAVLHQLFQNDISGFQGQHVAFPPFVFSPRPQRPPIWIGGGPSVALERTLRYGEAYFPLRSFGPSAAAETRRYFAEEAARRGRTPPEIVTGGTLEEDHVAAAGRLAALAEAGVNYYVADFGRYADVNGFMRELERFLTLILPQLESR